MIYIDYIIALVILIGFLLGFKDGLVRKIIGLAGLALGVLFAIEFSDELGRFLSPVFNDEIYFSNTVSGFIIFFLTILITSIIKRIVHPLDKVNRFVNQFLGGLTGSIQIIFFISGFLLFLNIFNIPSNDTRKDSLLYNGISSLVPNTIDFILGDNSKTKDIFKEYIEEGELPPVNVELPDSIGVKITE
ncbi:MAG: CvpA family protein [Bacteroidetes bacterium]|nr:CvpA family protein [Bacteroidota bacterium]